MFRHGMSTSLLEQHYAATRRIYHCCMLAFPTAGISLLFGFLASQMARQEMAPRFRHHIDFLNRTLLMTLGLLAFVLSGWHINDYASGVTGLSAGISGVIFFFASRLYLGWKALQVMYATDFSEETRHADLA